MTKEKPIGLVELIDKVKEDLLTTKSQSITSPLFSIDEVTLEITVTVYREANGGIQIYVLGLGGNINREDAQKITVKLTPLVDRVELLKTYQNEHPNDWQTLKSSSAVALFKGSQNEDQNATYAQIPDGQ